MPAAIRRISPVRLSPRLWRSANGSLRLIAEGGREEKSEADLAAAERAELVRLRREVRQLRLERDILSKAAAWFARETGTIPSGSSGS